MNTLNKIKYFRPIIFENMCLHSKDIPLSPKVTLLKKFGCITSFHTSSQSLQQSTEDTESLIPQRKYKKPVEWLPFRWDRRPKFNIYEQSGDLQRYIVVDPSLPKPDFELSEELNDASDDVKQYFSIGTAAKSEVKEVCRRNLLKRIQRHPFDYDSLEVQITLKTIQVRSFFEHKDNFKKHRRARVILPILIQKRNRLLKKLRLIDTQRFEWLCEELQLYFKPDSLGEKKEWYCKKWDLRKLTKDYCAKTIAGKKAAYHEELKKEQELFLKEKEEILAWIEEEEKALKLL